jgi:hypothetical protein
LVGTAAAGFTARPLWWIGIILCLTVFGIAASGKMMARPYEISGPGRSRFKRDLGAGLNASGWGAGIGIIGLITFYGERMFGAGKEFFLIGAALAGGFAVAASLWVRTSGNLGKSVGFGLATVLVGMAVNAATLFSPPGVMNFFVNSLAVGLFHAQFFTASFVFGHRTSPRAAVIAAGISGVAGYVAFVGIRMLFPDFKI